MEKTLHADYIIIGAGSAGAVLANRLSEQASVILVEAGPPDYRWDFRLHMPAALSMVLSSDTYNWYYHSEPEPNLGNRRLYCPRGRVLGGSSSINGMIFVRGHPGDYDRWAIDPALSDWRYSDCLPYFKRTENCVHGDDAFRGQHGPLTVTRSSADNPLHQAWLRAGGQAGFPLSSDFNGQTQEGLGRFDCTIADGRRFSTARGYLEPASKRTNLTVLTQTNVTRIQMDGTRATGIEVESRGRMHRVYADTEVILSAGAINSPALLQRSGIGDASVLMKLGIPVVADLPGVGQNLQDHLEIYVQYACRKPVSIYPFTRWYRKPLVGLAWYLGYGPGCSNHFETGAFLKSSPEQPYPDLQCHFLPVAMNYDGSEQHHGHGFQVHVGPMKPKSRGQVMIRSGDPGEAPRIQFNYLAEPIDRATMITGVEMVRDIISQAAFDEFRGEELQPGSLSLQDFITSRAESAYHPCGTCKMGSDENAVVDGKAAVNGVEGLRVVDASIMPEITNGNLNAPVIMMAEKLSDTILQEA